MSRIKSKAGLEICGDCGTSDPAWASINRGILLCSDCCSIHRSLGRHISIVKSLRQGSWSPYVLTFVTQLNAHGANSVWEHTLLDIPQKGTKAKPTSKDLLLAKSEFIRAKHVKLTYVLKPSDAADELSKQLHASVRTSNLETSLRLIVQGADVNYYSKEKGCTCIHVAARSGQATQAELLIVYGANLTALDAQGNNAAGIAKLNNHLSLSERLTEATYEVTDRLSYFLCGKRADHAAGQHIMIPPGIGRPEMNEQLKIARGKLQLVPNRMFEELVMDLYEEVDRRETEAIWATTALSPDAGAVPFLPTNPHLTATRNQGRQKLARFSHQEFAGLLVDVLEDSKRRQNIANLRPLEQTLDASDDDDPIYDAVCSDDDYAALTPIPQQVTPIKNPELDVLKEELEKSKLTIDELKELVVKLSSENTELKSKIPAPPAFEDDIPTTIATFNNQNDASTNQRRPVSMYEARQTPIKELSPGPHSNQTSPSTSITLMPLFFDVEKRTDILTKRIQELWKEMQNADLKSATFVVCAERLHAAIMDLNTIFPAAIPSEAVRSSLIMLNSNSHRMQRICCDLQAAIQADTTAQIELGLQEVRNCAYDLAMATKALITQFPQ